MRILIYIFVLVCFSIKGYTANQVHFPKKLNTSYNKILPFGQQMQGTAGIITNDLRLIERFIMPVRALIKNN